MKKLVFALVILLGLQIGTASADRLSQIMFPMDFIEAETKDYVFFDISLNGDKIERFYTERIRNNGASDMFFSMPMPEDATNPYKIRGSVNGGPMAQDDLTLEDMMEYFVDFCGDDILVAFDAFDYSLPALLEETDICGIPVNNRCVDLTWLSRIYFQTLASYKTEDLCIAAGYPYEDDYVSNAAHKIIEEAKKVYRLNRAAIYMANEHTEFKEWVTRSIEKKGGAKVNRIEINDHDGTPDPNDKIALIYVDCSNSDTQELKKYSDQLFKEVYNKYPLYQEFVIFWTLNGDKKTTFKVYNERSETVYQP